MSDAAHPLPQDKPYDICYWIDRGNVIVDIAPGWDSFAQANGAYELDPRRVIGRDLLSFVHGDVTRMFVHTLIQSARLQRKPLIHRYRCDSPDTRRQMEMRVLVDHDGLLRWEHRLLHAEPLGKRLVFRVAEGGSPRRFIVRCSICNRLKSPGGWHEPDLLPGDLPDDAPIPVIYGVCPSCQVLPGQRRPTLDGTEPGIYG